MSKRTSGDRPDNSKIEPQPRGARSKGNRPIDQAEAAERFLAAPRHQQQHDTRLWTLRQRRDDQMWAMPEWEEMRSPRVRHQGAYAQSSRHLSGDV